MPEKSSNYNEGERATYQNVPVPVGNPGEKIAELARDDRRQHPVMHQDKLQEAPEFSVEDIPSEPAGVHRLPYRPREYHIPATDRIAVNAGQKAGATVQSAADLLYAIAAGVRRKPAVSLVVAAGAGFVIGRLAR